MCNDKKCIRLGIIINSNTRYCNVVMTALPEPMKRQTRSHKNKIHRWFTYFMMISGLKFLDIVECGYGDKWYTNFKILSEGVTSIPPRPWAGPKRMESYFDCRAVL
jgi:hypothetical protein